jgi:hypothetical protein
MPQLLSGSLAAIAVWLAIAPAPSVTQAQVPPIRAYQPKATENARKLQVLDQQQKAAADRFDLAKYPISDRHLTHWQESLWAIGVITPSQPYVFAALDNVTRLTTAPNLSDPQKAIIDTAMQVSTQLYTLKPAVYGKLKQNFVNTINLSNDPQWVAISLMAISKSASYPSEANANTPQSADLSTNQKSVQTLIAKVKQRFPQWSQDPHLRTTIENLQSDRPVSTPNMRDLLTWQVVPNQPHLYVFCRPNRDVLCTTVLKDRNGKFVKNPVKQLWSTQLLLQSLHNLDWNFTNGRTPQGLYRMEGISRQPDDEVFHAYGQFSLVNLFLPFEDGVNSFLPSQKGKFTGSLKDYQTLLPPSWRSYAPIQQAYWAGNMGRSLFRIHGSGAALDFFGSKPAVVNPQNFDWNPTLGCLSAIEIYDQRGSLLKADMPKMLDALNTVGSGKIEGYLIVVDIPNPSAQDQAIALTEIAKYID